MHVIIVSFLCSVQSYFSQSGITIIDSIFSNNEYRTYRLYIPPSYAGNSAVPLILNLHGYTSNALQQQLYSNFMPIADTAGFLMVYPQGKKDIYGNPFWNAGITSSPNYNDTLFINQLIDSLKLVYNIDLSRVYMTGLSNGGFMSHYMACFCNHKITAIASVAGTFFTYWPPCNPSKIIPVMQIHGTADTSVPYNGNGYMLGADSTVKIWVLKNGCNPVPTYSSVPDMNMSDGCTAEHYLYYKPSYSPSVVEFFKINNGAHTWPGSPYIINTTNQDINASAEIWRFFRQFSSNTFTGFPLYDDVRYSIYPNPASEFIYIVSSDVIQNIQIIDVMGRVMLSQSVNERKKLMSLSIQTLSTGIYFVYVNNQFVKKMMVIE